MVVSAIGRLHSALRRIYTILVLGLSKPPLLWRPSQVSRFVARRYFGSGGGRHVAETPWGELEVDAADQMGRLVWQLGVYELIVSEALVRLIDAGDTCVDVGANIGHMSSIMAWRAGETGRVFAFEPNPNLFSQLTANVDRHGAGFARVVSHRKAIHSSDRRMHLVVPDERGPDFGRGFVVEDDRPGSQEVEATTLSALPELSHIGLLKIDVEGNEGEVLRGAAELMREGTVRDVIFEDHDSLESGNIAYLEAHAYTVFRLHRTAWRPLLLPHPAVPAITFEPPNFLATLEPRRAEGRFAPSGWKLLQHRQRT